MSTATRTRSPRLSAVLRQEERVTPLELFFDLVFVLAITQCTALMAHEPTWRGVAKGVLVLGVLWWSWVGYAWLTSVVDPEEGSVRLAMFAAMAALLVAALCVPHVFDDTALLFACAYLAVRAGQIVLFVIASRDDPGLRHSVMGLAISTAIGTSILVAASFANDLLQGGLWALALALDMGGPLVIDASGWRLQPSHFAERHGLIVLIALGESIVAIGVGSEAGVDAGVVVAAVLGTAVAGALWWLYFDVVALVAERRLMNAAPGLERNRIGRDSYSYLHFPMVAGIVLLAFGLKKTLVHIEDPLDLVQAAAMLGGAAVYLLAHVAFRLRNVHRLSTQRLALAIVLVALVPAATAMPALVTLAVLAALLVALIVYEARRFAELRDRLRHQLAE
jgi:low temperature requirement protein LtrA